MLIFRKNWYFEKGGKELCDSVEQEPAGGGGRERQESSQLTLATFT